jgi:pantoate kinase
MPITPEAKVKKKVVAILKSMGAYYAMPIGTGYGNSGVPDFLVCHKGRFIGIECKANGNKPTTLQLSNLASIAESGGVAFVIDETNVESLVSILEHM